MRYPAGETAEKHERILDEAARLFRERGFAGAGVADIMKAAGLTHGAFYAHFGSKNKLEVEAIGRAFEQSGAALERKMDRSQNARSAFLDAYLNAPHRDAPGRGCAMAALAPEVAREPAVRVAFTIHVKNMLSMMTRRFGWKRNDRKKAIHTLSAAVGALALARAVDDPELSNEILESVRESLGSI